MLSEPNKTGPGSLGCDSKTKVLEFPIFMGPTLMKCTQNVPNFENYVPNWVQIWVQNWVHNCGGAIKLYIQEVTDL